VRLDPKLLPVFLPSPATHANPPLLSAGRFGSRGKTTCQNAYFVYFTDMNATLTEVSRNTKRVFRPVQNGQPVQITEHGKTIARISPDYPTVTMSPEEFRALPISDEDLNNAINKAIAESRQ
jgi:antitoxin (DNA-binding transcriptional repressor) of toxin-antitoxin stability system